VETIEELALEAFTVDGNAIWGGHTLSVSFEMLPRPEFFNDGGDK
jgi:hypothetical protein